MREPDFQQLQRELLRVGIAPRHARRTVVELREHLEDLVSASMQDGLDRGSAQQMAARQMGDLQQVAIAMRACPELRSWSYRFPRLALVVYPLTCVALLPTLPLLIGIAHASQVARWTACVLAGGVVTAAIFLLLQLSIVLG